MKGSLATILSLLLAALGGSPTRALEIYVLSGSGTGLSNTTTAFGKIDTDTGSYTEIVPAVSGTTIVANLTWNPSISAFYVTSGVSPNTTLHTLTTSGTLSSSIGTLGGSTTIFGMAYRSSDNTIYAYNYEGTDSTGTINTATGTWTTLNSSTGFVAASPIGGRYSILNDTIYVAANTTSVGGPRFGTIGFTASSSLSIIRPDSTFQNMVLASDGVNLYGVIGTGTSGQQALYSINPASGVPTFLRSVSGTGLGTRFYGAGVAVPEPSTYVLGVIATGLMAVIARRRRAAARG